MEAHPGLNVVLTLDLVVQSIVERELAEAMKKHTPISACATVVRPRTGEILAMATVPTYDRISRAGRPRIQCETGSSRTWWSPVRHSKSWSSQPH